MKAYASLAIAAAAAAAIAGAALWHHHAKTQALTEARAAGLAQGRAELAAYRGQVERDALAQAQQRQRAQLEIDTTQKENANESERLAARDRAALLDRAGRADAAGQRLQHHVDALADAARGGGLPGDPASAGERAASVVALQNLVGACRRALQQLGRDDDEVIDDGRRRHGECIADYEAVRTRINGLARP